jgi:hypothetical protein
MRCSETQNGQQCVLEAGHIVPHALVVPPVPPLQGWVAPKNGRSFIRVIAVIALAILGLVVVGTVLRKPAATIPAVAQGSSDSALTAIMAGNLAEFRSSDWYGSLHLNAGAPDVAVRDGVLFVATILPAGDIATATTICHAAAALTNDPNTSRPLGIIGVVVISGGQKITDCRPPN